ncbi:MAG: hypothetical protein AAGD25_14845 [Cyanobacteria bacterium P01_F01_bin.150]
MDHYSGLRDRHRNREAAGIIGSNNRGILDAFDKLSTGFGF